MARLNDVSKLVLWLFLMTSVVVAGASQTVTVSVSPSSAQVNTNGQVQFTATVTGTYLDIVVWNLSGSGCSGLACGSITSDGVYMAPATAPNPPIVTVTATSIVDGTSRSAQVTVAASGHVSVSVSPSQADIAVLGQQQFKATVTGTMNTAVSWSVSGIGCNGNSCGTIISSGLYTAPAVVPTPATATVTATSVADPTKSASALVVIESAQAVSVKVSPASAQVPTGGQQQFRATVTGTTNPAVIWTLSGSGCSGASCGTINSGGLYTAPASGPIPPTVKVTATAVADPQQSASAIVTIVAGPTVTLSPSSVQVATNGQVQFTATVKNSPSSVVTWSLSGVGCSGILCGSITSTGQYTAPSTVPSPPTVTVTATLLSKPSVSGSATVTVTGVPRVSISISPTSATVNTGAQQQFTASVTGTTNTAVTWSVSGYGCAGSACGTITSGGLYTAPSVVPTPQFAIVTATSQADPTASASAIVTITQRITVSVSPATAQVNVGANQQFTAQVSGTTNQAVTWSISGSGCSGSACGIIDSSGLFTAPGTPPTPPTITVTATSNANPTKFGMAAVTIVIPIIVKIIPTSVLVTIGSQQLFQATVTGSTDHAIIWSVSGTGCSGAGCGTITQQGLYTAPATVPNPATVNVTATSHADPTKSAVALATIAPSNNSKLKGQYAFLFKGFDQFGVYQAAGSITADGNGRITGGEEDISNTTAPATIVPITGAYQVNADNRGTMTITTRFGTSSYVFALNATATAATFQEFDQSGKRGSGELKLQDPRAFDPSQLTGGYAVSLSGVDFAGGRIGALAAIYPDGFSFVSGSSMDVNDAGNEFPTFASFNGSYSVSNTGRGTVTLSVPGFAGGVFNFAIYVISASEFVLVSIDPLSVTNPIFSGFSEAQSGSPFSSQSFIGASIYNLTGVNGTFSQTTVGLLSFDGSSSISGALDQNSGGSVNLGDTLTGAYDINVNGRGDLDLIDSRTGLLVWVIYAISPNRAFILDTSSNVGVGEMKKQIATPPFSNSSLEGGFTLGSGEAVSNSAALMTGVSQFDGMTNHLGLGNAGGTLDVSTVSTLYPNRTMVGTYAMSSRSNNGRGAINLTSPAAQSFAFWIVSESETFAIDTDVSNTQPSILFFEQ